VKLISEPAVPGMPEDAIDRTIDFVHNMMLYWLKIRKGLFNTQR